MMVYRIIVSGVIFFTFLFLQGGVINAQENIGKIKCVCIDPGHGGNDPGALGNKSQEKNIVLKVALRLGQVIKEKHPDVKVVYTRDKDIFIPLNQRGKIANKHHADLFISIHANSVDNKSVTGIETFILGENNSAENMRVAMKENSVIKYEEDYSVTYEGFDPEKPESYIIFSIMQNIYQEQSLHIAGYVQEELVKITNKRDRGVKSNGLLVLKDIVMPGILVELPFISNPEDEKFLNSPREQEKMVQAIARAFTSYKNNVENTSAMLSQQADVVKNESGDLFYAIQIASTTSPLEKFHTFNNKYEVGELKNGKRYSYYVKACNDYITVKNELPRVKELKEDCFIIAVYKGKPISVAEANELNKKLNK